jgi:hypothetical protein
MIWYNTQPNKSTPAKGWGAMRRNMAPNGNHWEAAAAANNPQLVAKIKR